MSSPAESVSPTLKIRSPSQEIKWSPTECPLGSQCLLGTFLTWLTHESLKADKGRVHQAFPSGTLWSDKNWCEGEKTHFPELRASWEWGSAWRQLVAQLLRRLRGGGRTPDHPQQGRTLFQHSWSSNYPTLTHTLSEIVTSLITKGFIFNILLVLSFNNESSSEW